jgi:hypothetical protein
MSGLYLDGGGPLEREAFLVRLHRQSGFGGSLDEYRARIEALDAHPYAARAIRDLVLRNDQDTAIAGLRLTAIHSLHEDREIWIGGISRLVTRESTGAEESASRIVEMTLALLADEQVDGATIFANGDPRFLRDLGFEVVGGEGIDVDLVDLDGRSAPRVTVRPLILTDGPDMRRIHERSGAGEPLWMLRDAERWDYLLRAAALRGSKSDPVSLVQLACERDGRLIGYAIANPQVPVLDLLDLGLEDPDDAVLGALLASLYAEGRTRGCERMRTPLLPGATGRLLRTRFRPASLRDGLFLVAALDERLDLRAVVEGCGGYAGLERA